MDTTTALTIIGGILMVLGIAKVIFPKQFNQNIMGDLHAEAVNPAAAIRVALGGAILISGIVALMCRNLPAEAASSLLMAMGIGFIVVMASVASNKFRGFSSNIPMPPMVIFTVLIVVAFSAA